jgi:MSHA biogenesis protein MshL
MKEWSVRNRNQVPGLGDVPVVGALFGNSKRAVEKSELVILVRPTIIRNVNDWQDDIVNTRRRIGELQRDNGRVEETDTSEMMDAQ